MCYHLEVDLYMDLNMKHQIDYMAMMDKVDLEMNACVCVCVCPRQGYNS